MQYFIDSADIKEIKEAQSWGRVDGVTTNPTLVLRAGYSTDELRKIYLDICLLVRGPVSLEVTAHEQSTAGDLIEQGRKLWEVERNVVVKIPVIPGNPAWQKAVRMLSRRKIPVNVTLVATLEQALEATRQGAAYVSPFVGRLEDAGLGDAGIDLIRSFRQRLDSTGYNRQTKILAASIRTSKQVNEAIAAGADCITMPLELFRYRMLLERENQRALRQFSAGQLDSAFTRQWLQKFNEDYETLQNDSP